MLTQLGEAIVVVVIVRFVWSAVAGMLESPDWVGSNRKDLQQRQAEIDLRNQTLGWDKHPRYRNLR